MGDKRYNMNDIAVQGYIRDIQFSHDVGSVDYYKANIVCPGVNGREDDLLYIRFKKLSNRYKENDFIEFRGNLRSYSTKDETGKSQVQLYIFTYFDLPDLPINTLQIDGRICKQPKLITSYSGKKFLKFIIANNIFKGDRKINSYLPCTASGDVIDKLIDCKVNDFVTIGGEFHSHTYKRKIDKEIILAHEVVVKSAEVKKEE